MPRGPGDAERYDESTARAVGAFHRRHGLAADALVGGRTRAALGVAVEDRIAQLELARRRLAERPPARPWIRVNIPGFALELIDGGRTVFAMPVVVGRTARPTPVFESAISSIVLHPTWTVPADLAHHDQGLLDSRMPIQPRMGIDRPGERINGITALPRLLQISG